MSAGDAYRKAAADLRARSAALPDRAGLVVRKVAMDTQADAQRFAPVDTGNLRSSINTTTQGLRAEVTATADYAVFVENGTSRMAPRPFMGPATERHTPVFREAMARLAEGA
ncbi:HK97-gp10 family putative phage morphogenesis protein [Brachybacterium nesterenkovii]|uniref:HK97-gp10 family putative phage morphogenesis protein n=1 Tax=Brachybacterium nesterenkovii TaxID=47847 RepID=UPI00321BEAA4